MFGTVFLLTQYLQFVLGFSPLEAGVRVMPVATMVIAAPLSARFTEKFGTKRVVAAGLVIVAIAMAVLATIDTASGYGQVALASPSSVSGWGRRWRRRPTRSWARSPWPRQVSARP